MNVEIAYAPNESEQLVIPFTFTSPITAIEAVKQSGLLEKRKELDTDKLQLGCFGKKIPFSYAVKEGDRIEIYRPLTITPMEKRRLLAKRNTR